MNIVIAAPTPMSGTLGRLCALRIKPDGFLQGSLGLHETLLRF